VTESGSAADNYGTIDRYAVVDATRKAEIGGTAVNHLYEAGKSNLHTAIPLTYGFHQGGRRVPPVTVKSDAAACVATGLTKMQFCIPIYSGVIGLLMPEKKLLPLNLLPLDIEITLNQHAFYSN